MRWSIIVLVSLALACSKKETPAPVEAEEAKAQAPAKPTEPATAEEAGGTEPSVAEGEGEPTAEKPSLPPELEADTPPIGNPPTIRVLDEGDEPRQALAWKLKPGLTQKLSLKLGSNSTLALTMIKFQSPPHTDTYRITMESEAIKSAGALGVRFTIDKARAKYDYPRPGQPDPLKAGAASLQGISGSYTFTPRGAVEGVLIDLPPDASRTTRDMADNLAWAFTRMFPVLPEAPVGQGAKWTVHRGVQQGGIHVNELSTIEVTKRRGSRVELRIQVEQTATAQTYEPPGGSGKVELTSLWAKAEGAVSLDLENLTPLAATVNADIRKSGNKRAPEPPPMMIQTSRSLEIPGR